MNRGILGAAIVLVGSMMVHNTPTQAEAMSTPTSKLLALPNPTEVFLSTIFLGDLDRTVAYISSLTVGYQRFLTQFVDFQSCAVDDVELHDECVKLKDQESTHITSGDWTRFYIFRHAEFSQLGDGKSVGTYEFVKSVPLDRKGHCNITMQLTAVVANLDFPVRREFFGKCESTKR